MSYPIIISNNGAQEVLVPGVVRSSDGAIFVGEEDVNEGFTSTLVLFVYPGDGTHKVYLLAPQDEQDTSKRYTRLHDTMGRGISSSLDYELWQVYGVDPLHSRS